MIVQCKILVRAKTAYRKYRNQQLERITSLAADRAIEAKLVDEETDRFEAAIENENAAKEAVTTAEQNRDAAKAKVAQAQADIDEALADVDSVKAELERSRVLLDYTVIRSPYDGVVTKRNFHGGGEHGSAFIRSADAGGIPVVAVDRTDLMRVVVQIPDRDVPYVDRDDPVEIEFDAIPKKVFKGVVARTAHAEDPQTRTMRTEIDLENTDGRLKRNMYGRVRLKLQIGAPSAVRIPTTALLSHDEDRATVRVVRDGHVHLVAVETGIDTGSEVEVLKGLRATDHVVIRASTPIAEGTEVNETIASTSNDAH
jgi:RND family efflux transporter MFP subunit